MCCTNSASSLERTPSELVVRLGEFAHELRNALATAVIAFRLIQEGKARLDGPTATIVMRCHQRMEDLMSQTITGVRLRSGAALRRERILVATLLRDVVAATFPGPDVALSIDDSDPIEIEVDVAILSSALYNLVQNAVKFTKSGGQVTLRARGGGERVVVEVEDRCGGLPPGQTDDLFRPFVQGTTRRGGVGLGLDIAREAVEAHGGRLWARDLPGVGCIFSLELPCPV